MPQRVRLPTLFRSGYRKVRKTPGGYYDAMCYAPEHGVAVFESRRDQQGGHSWDFFDEEPESDRNFEGKHR